MHLNGEHLIRLPLEHSKRNYADGFLQWVKILAMGDYERAIEALLWPKGTTWTPESLEKQITLFFGGNKPWSVVIPNDRLVKVVFDGIEQGMCGESGWFLAHIPLTTKPNSAKDDDIPLMGLATSFFVRQHEGSFVFEFEIFHV
jgi:hypothetical protein